MKTKSQNIQIAKKIIKLMKKAGLAVDCPYDVENWAEEYLTNHTNLFKTGEFPIEN